MSKDKLTAVAITYIIEKRNDRSKKYSFRQIADLLLKEYGIKVSGQAVGQSYKTNKDNEEYKPTPFIEEKLKSQKNIKSVREVPKKAKSEVKIEPVKPLKSNRDFDENAGKKFNADDYF